MRCAPPRRPWPTPSLSLLPPCLSVITGPNCSLWHPFLSPGPLPFEEMPPASLLYVSFVSFHDSIPPFPFPPLHRYTVVTLAMRDHPQTYFIDKYQLVIYQFVNAIVLKIYRIF